MDSGLQTPGGVHVDWIDDTLVSPVVQVPSCAHTPGEAHPAWVVRVVDITIVPVIDVHVPTGGSAAKTGIGNKKLITNNE